MSENDGHKDGDVNELESSLLNILEASVTDLIVRFGWDDTDVLFIAIQAAEKAEKAVDRINEVRGILKDK